MPVITAIKPQKNKKRVNIYLDGKFGFGIDLENFMKLGLKVEQELSNEEINKIIEKSELQKTYDKLLRFATLRPRSEKEINDWFKKHQVHESLHKGLFNRLKRLGLLDDRKFVKWWVDQRMSFRPRGKRVLVAELRQKGVSKRVVEEVLEKVKLNETTVAKRLLKAKNYRWEKLKGQEKVQKMSAFLARRGISWEVIKKVVRAF